MTIHVRFYGQLRTSLGEHDRTVDLPDGADCQQLLRQLAAVLPPDARRFVTGPDGQPSSSLLLVINDAVVDRSAHPPLRDGDEVTLMTAIAGGYGGGVR